MTDFNPLSGAILGSAQAQHQVDVEKQRQLRRAQALRKNVAVQDDQLEHQVESPEELPEIHDERQGGGGQQPGKHDRRGRKDDGRPRLDVKA